MAEVKPPRSTHICWASADAAPEALIFDKAEEASELVRHRDEYKRLVKKIEELKQLRKSADEAAALTIDAEMVALNAHVEQLREEIKSRENNGDES